MSVTNTINNLQSKIFIDIETVPQNRDFSYLNEKWQHLFIEKNAKIISDNKNFEDFYNERAGILAEFGKIICISIGYLYMQEEQLYCKVKNIFGDDEKEILKKFINSVHKFQNKFQSFQFVGHNIKEFDIPYICRRIFVNQLAYPEFLPQHNEKPWDSKNIDTLQWWRFGDYKSYISLDLLANTLNVPTSKTDIRGSDVRDIYYNENNLERIAKYCARDVVVVANIMLRFYNLPLLKEDKIVETNE